MQETAGSTPTTSALFEMELDWGFKAHGQDTKRCKLHIFQSEAKHWIVEEIIDMEQI